MNGAMRITDKAQLPGIIGDLRTMLQMRHKDLAAEAGFFPSQISTWLAGERSMDVTSVIRLANALGYDLALIPREEA
jgi:transcriptional regulator with XRE-family HTH domain